MSENRALGSMLDYGDSDSQKEPEGRQHQDSPASSQPRSEQPAAGAASQSARAADVLAEVKQEQQQQVDEGLDDSRYPAIAAANIATLGSKLSSKVGSRLNELMAQPVLHLGEIDGQLRVIQADALQHVSVGYSILNNATTHMRRLCQQLAAAQSDIDREVRRACRAEKDLSKCRLKLAEFKVDLKVSQQLLEAAKQQVGAPAAAAAAAKPPAASSNTTEVRKRITDLQQRGDRYKRQFEEAVRQLRKAEDTIAELRRELEHARNPQLYNPHAAAAVAAAHGAMPGSFEVFAQPQLQHWQMAPAQGFAPAGMQYGGRPWQPELPSGTYDTHMPAATAAGPPAAAGRRKVQTPDKRRKQQQQGDNGAKARRQHEDGQRGRSRSPRRHDNQGRRMSRSRSHEHQ